jgi:hypothetical protein
MMKILAKSALNTDGSEMSAQRSPSRVALVISLGIVVQLVVGCFAASSFAASTSVEQLRYKVQHSMFGDIGTYANLVQIIGDVTTVQTTAHFLVKMLGVGLHREDAKRTERWQDGRLMSFSGVTRKNDETIEVKGEAKGNDFVISSPLGIFNAPATIQPANPWSIKCLSSRTMMRVDNGKIEAVHVSGGAPTAVTIDGTSVPVREYDIAGATRYKVWFDQSNVPVMFTVDDDSGKVTFTLER